jgi:hypothetical protein
LIGNDCSNVKRIIRILSVLFIAATPLLLKTHSFAASTATMYLTPSSATVAIGDTFAVDIYEDSGTQDVNAAKADLTYNPNILEYVSVTSSSAFSISASTSGGGGSVSIDRGAIPAVTGPQIVATVTFKGKGGGTSAVNFGSGSKVLANSGPQANTNILTSTTGGNYTVPSPPPPPAPPPTPAPAPAPSPSPSPNPASPSPAPKTSPAPAPTPRTAPAKDATAPAITGVTVTDIGTTSALVTWYTNEPATSQVDYGITTNYELTNGNGLYVSTHKLSLSYKLLNPDTEFHYRVKSIDAAGNVATSGDQTFTTKAGNSTLAVKVVDQKNNPVKSAKVTIGKTDKNGHATLSGLAPGTASLAVEYKGHKTTKSVKVDPSTDSAVAQSVTVAIQVSKNYLPVILLPTLGLLGLAAAAFFLNGGGPKAGSSGDEPFVVGGGSGATTAPGGTVTPPEALEPSASSPSPYSSKTAKESASKSETQPFDPSKDPPPPTIVRPTIPPRG